MGQQGWTRVEEPSGWTKVPDAVVSSPNVADVLSGRVGHDTNLSDSPDVDWKTKLNEALQSAAHPQSLNDLASLVIPSDAGAIVGRSIGPAKQAVAKYGGAVIDVGTSFLPARARSALGVLRTLSPTEWHSPLTVAGREARDVAASRAFNDLPLAQQMDRLPTTTGVLRTRSAMPPAQSPTPFNDRPLYQQMEQLPQTPAPLSGHVTEPPNLRLGRETELPPAAPTSTTEAPPAGLSTADRTALARQGFTPDVIAKIEQQMGSAAHQPVMAPTETSAAPLGVTPTRQTELLDKFGGRAPEPAVSHQSTQTPSPLAQPRIDVGAARVGRDAGMTTDEVRQAAGPVLDEARGEASPILPQKALTKIIDDMRQIAPGADREAYVARATSGKAKWQVENIRRTLEHLGLLVPAAVSVREGLLRLMTSHEPTSGTP